MEPTIAGLTPDEVRSLQLRVIQLEEWKQSAISQLIEWHEVYEYTRAHGGRLGYAAQEETLRLLKRCNETS